MLTTTAKPDSPRVALDPVERQRLLNENLPEVRYIARRIHDRLPSGGALLIAEKLLDDDKSGPRWALMQNLGMLLYTEGKERTLSEYTTLLEQAGFTEVKGATTPSPLDAVLALKP